MVIVVAVVIVITTTISNIYKHFAAQLLWLFKSKRPVLSSFPLSFSFSLSTVHRLSMIYKQKNPRVSTSFLRMSIGQRYLQDRSHAHISLHSTPLTLVLRTQSRFHRSDVSIKDTRHWLARIPRFSYIDTRSFGCVTHDFFRCTFSFRFICLHIHRQAGGLMCITCFSLISRLFSSLLWVKLPFLPFKSCILDRNTVVAFSFLSLSRTASRLPRRRRCRQAWREEIWWCLLRMREGERGMGRERSRVQRDTQ